MKEQKYMVYSDKLPVILVDEKPVCQGRILERDIRTAILNKSGLI